MKNHTKATIQFYKRGAPKCRLRLLSSIEPGNKVEVAVVFENNFIVEQTLLYLVYDEPDLTSYRDNKKKRLCQEISTEVPDDDFNWNRKKKNRVE